MRSVGAAIPIRADISAEEVRRLAARRATAGWACRLLRLGQRPRRHEPRAGGAPGGGGPPDAAGLGDPVPRRRRAGPARSAQERPPELARRRQLATFKALVLRGPAPERDGVAVTCTSCATRSTTCRARSTTTACASCAGCTTDGISPRPGATWRRGLASVGELEDPRVGVGAPTDPLCADQKTWGPERREGCRSRARDRSRRSPCHEIAGALSTVCTDREAV
jgi:hypothetical protein